MLRPRNAALLKLLGQVAMRRYRRSNNYRSSDFSKPASPSTSPSTYNPSWLGDFQDFYRAPKIHAPDYAHYRYVSKLEVLTAQDVPQEIYPNNLRVSEIERILSHQIISNPFETNSQDFSVPEIECPKFPDAPIDPRPLLLSAKKPNALASPPKPSPVEVKAADLNILGIRLRSINDKIMRGRQREHDELLKAKIAKWQIEVDHINELNRQADEKFHVELETNSHIILYDKALAFWRGQRDKLRFDFEAALQKRSLHQFEFVEAAERDKATIASLKKDVTQGFTDAIETSAIIALRNSRFQSEEARAKYDAESQILLIDYHLPNLTEVEIVEDTNFTSNGRPKAIPTRRLAELRDAALYGFVLGAAYDFANIFENLPVRGIAINGWLSRNDPATGKYRSDVTMSLFAQKAELLELSIEDCDPRIAFKALKGSVGSSPQDYTPIQPIFQLNDKDDRIVAGREVLSAINENENLGAMHWDDFEHLIREVFELEFATNGAKVNVTRASRDSGVDAIVFDPDPIRGGKIVIQAKRYVNTVDVSAVRDLFGTVQNEGANKGILITTSGFGPDSFEFAKGKPLTLMNGQNLLWLLEKHGRKFVIDLPSARKVLKERGWL